MISRMISRQISKQISKQISRMISRLISRLISRMVSRMVSRLISTATAATPKRRGSWTWRGEDPDLGHAAGGLPTPATGKTEAGRLRQEDEDSLVFPGEGLFPPLRTGHRRSSPTFPITNAANSSYVSSDSTSSLLRTDRRPPPSHTERPRHYLN